ncbi:MULTISPECIES: hypothetical protein [Burkholderia]|uniref:hypothetical protein n=1 Tax=Burkholderia TaxID=32008 RepID=UPI00065D5FFF|nr:MULTISPECIES: hypothetical protein [Burkholderia]KMN59633.1 hypothetical protein VK92_15835 [Burkholderia sp. LK4]
MKPLLFEKCDECGIGAGLRCGDDRASRASWFPLAFVSAGADHAAILCANTGCLRERHRVRKIACDGGDPCPERMTEKQHPAPLERERGVVRCAARVSEYAGA